MVLRSFEDRLERLVEGVFSRAFKSGVQPVEVGHRLVREIEASRTIDPSGQPLSPNRFVVRLAAEDCERFLATDESVVDELTGIVRSYAAQHHLGFLGQVSVELQSDPSLRVGVFRLHPSYDDRVVGAASPAWLDGPDGSFFEMQPKVMTIGRLGTCDIVLDDQNVSRQHAEIHPMGERFELLDLGSTNGCRVNGQRVQRHVLVDGDEITLGPVSLLFRHPGGTHQS